MDNSVENDLPPGYTYICTKSDEELEIIRIKEVTSEEAAEMWVEELCNKRKVLWRVDKTFPNAGRRNIFRKDYRCQYYTDKRATGERKSKNTNCPAKLQIKIKRYFKYSKAKIVDDLVQEYPCIVFLRRNHNHPPVGTESSHNTKKSRKKPIRLSSVFQSDEQSNPEPNNVNVQTQPLMVLVAGGMQPGIGWLQPLQLNQNSSQEMLRTLNVCFDKNSQNVSQSMETDEKNSEEMTENDQSTIEQQKSQLQELFDRIKDGLSSNPKDFVPAVEKMLKNVKDFASTENGLVSAMYTFGTCSEVKSTTETVAKQLVQHSRKTSIGVQPFAVRRRKFLLKKKKKTNPGQPTIITLTPKELSQHNYVNFGMLPKENRTTQQNLN